MIQMTYKKANGDIIQRYRKTYPPYKKGAKTSMGWTVVDIKYQYGKKFYSLLEYDKLVDKYYKKHKKIFRIKKTLYTVYINMGYCILLLIFFRFFNNFTTMV